MSRRSLPIDEMIDEPDDFESAYRSNAPLIYRFMLWRTKDEMLSQDLTSNVFEKAWRTRKNFKGGSARAWLYRIARTTLIDHWRKKKDIAVDDVTISRVVSDAVEFGQAYDHDAAIADMQKALTKLPSEMRDVIGCRFIRGLSAAETACELGISEANVRVIQYRALKKLRGYLQ